MQTTGGLVLLAMMTATAMAQPKAKPATPVPPAPSPAPPPTKTEKRVRVNLPVIEILDPSGSMTEPSVRAAIVKVEPELLKCAETSKWQSTAFAWLVTDWRGKVSKLELAVDSAAVEKCLGTVLKTVVVQNVQVRATAFVKLGVGVPSSDDPMHTLQ